MICIQTKFVGPTNHKGARISVKSSRGRVMYQWDHALGVEDNHAKAAEKYARKFDWQGHWHIADSLDGCGYVFVRACLKFAA